MTTLGRHAQPEVAGELGWLERLLVVSFTVLAASIALGLSLVVAAWAVSTALGMVA